MTPPPSGQLCTPSFLTSTPPPSEQSDTDGPSTDEPLLTASTPQESLFIPAPALASPPLLPTVREWASSCPLYRAHRAKSAARASHLFADCPSPKAYTIRKECRRI
ncbi:uncharacterized protein N7498_000002 [Penicillium cinerascens]|uniref:Uncharacterized protein n=1 Tax=Penicillium cinerascens TaxID=70096 RepID=A0A9W9NDL2_9EURO|nr:uncharacterized protein N7498_000002 [Penicillium cinerascens]KAJ5217903.1 hypothetical protein N7498_000002 [Penicillium cinerascens]